MQWMDTLWNNGWAENRKIQANLHENHNFTVLSVTFESHAAPEFIQHIIRWLDICRKIIRLRRPVCMSPRPDQNPGLWPLFHFSLQEIQARDIPCLLILVRRCCRPVFWCADVCFYSDVVKLADTLTILKCCNLSSGHSLNTASNHGHLFWCTLTDVVEVPRGVEMSRWDASRHGRGRFGIDAETEYNRESDTYVDWWLSGLSWTIKVNCGVAPMLWIVGGRYLCRRYVEGRQSSSASDNKNSQSIFFNGHLGAHVGFYDLAGKHDLDETHAERDFCLTTVFFTWS